MKKFILIRTKHGNTYYYNVPMQRLMYLHPIEAFLADNLINPNEISLDKLYSSYDKQYNEEEINCCVSLRYQIHRHKWYRVFGLDSE